MTRARLEQLRRGAAVLRSRAVVAQAKRAGADPRAEAFENLLLAIDRLLAVLELEAGEHRKLN